MMLSHIPRREEASAGGSAQQLVQHLSSCPCVHHQRTSAATLISASWSSGSSCALEVPILAQDCTYLAVPNQIRALNMYLEVEVLGSLLTNSYSCDSQRIV